jgi:hypothetical protein
MKKVNMTSIRGEYIRRSCTNYIERIFGDQLIEIADSCRKTHPRGINIVVIPTGQLGGIFTPTQCTDVGRYFMDYNTTIDFVINLPEQTKKAIEDLINKYDPKKEILFAFLLNIQDGENKSVTQLYRYPIYPLMHIF